MDVPKNDRSVGRYRVHRRIGTGGMSVVYRAYDPSLDRNIALKILPPWEDESAFRRLEREARAMAQLTHPNVAAVYEVGRHDDRCYIAMELVEGQTLRDWAQETPRPWSEILRVYLQAGRGLSAAHRGGLVHRDFKPSNVLMGDDGRVRVVDFGLARSHSWDPSGESLLPADTYTDMNAAEIQLEAEDEGDPSPRTRGLRPAMSVEPTQESDITAVGIVSGTPAYMAPEQHNGEPATPLSDQFSFAIALWEALYRERPFPGNTPFALAQSITAGKISDPPPGYVPGWVENILRRGLSPEPEERHDTMGAMLAAFVFTWRVMHG